MTDLALLSSEWHKCLERKHSYRKKAEQISKLGRCGCCAGALVQSKSLGSVFTNGNYMSCDPLLYFMRYMQYLLVLCFYLFAVILRLHTEAEMEEGIAISSNCCSRRSKH